MGRPPVVAALAAAVVLATAVTAQGQVARVTGTVRDEAGKPLKGATVTAHNPEQTPPTFTASTDDKGRFAILGLRGGRWSFTVRMPGFDAMTVTEAVTTGRPTDPIEARLARSAQAAPGPLEGLSAPDVQRRIDAAEALADSGNLDGAIAGYREVLTRVPALTSVYLRIGQLQERKPDPIAALATYRELARREPDNPRALAAIERLSR